jgi:RNA polymerase sigma factor (sigma-70 family)
LKHCDRVTRRKRVQTEPIDEHTGVASNAPRPDEAAAAREVHDEVLAVLRGLPDHQRAVTTLFYIDGYSQNEIADFLEVPVTTVKKRLHDARNRMRGRLMNMVKETLERHAPDERFSKRIVA